MVNHINRDNNDIYKYKSIGFFFKNKTFLALFKIAIAALFLYAIVFGFINQSSDNIFTTGLFWGLFWPFFMVITLGFFGRLFCGICPHGFIGKYITQFGLNKKVPDFLSKGFVGIFILFIGWWFIYYMFPGLYKTPYSTSMIFTVMTLFAIASFYVYEKMAYCKYLCPIGMVSRAFSKVGVLKLSTYKSACTECKTFECSKACSHDLKPFTFNKKQQMDDCTLCMDCSSACEAVAFTVQKPSYTLFSKFKVHKAEVWTFILITAAISITMSFHHALGRSAIVEEFIWTRTARYFESMFSFGSIDTVGLFAFTYAVLFTLIFSMGGLWIASRMMQVSYEKTFYTLGYAFAPLFIIGGMSHMGEFFFYHYASDTVNAFIQAFHLDMSYMEPLATRRDKWVHIFGVFKYIAAIWALIIMIVRMKQLETTSLKKVLALPFASALILFYLGLNLYTGYVFKEYGAQKRGHNHDSMMKQGGHNGH